MSFRFLLLRYAFKDLLYRKKFTILFIVNLTIGIFSFLLVDSVKASFNTYLDNNSREITTADITIRGRRAMQETEAKALQELYKPEQLARKINYFSMMKKVGSSTIPARLVEVNLISPTYPLYGKILLKNFNGDLVDWKDAQQDMNTNPHLVITKEAQMLFDIQEGDNLKIGDRTYQAKYLLERDVGNRLRVSALAYKVYVGEVFQDDRALIEKGSTARYRYYIKLPPESDGTLQEEVNHLKKTLMELQTEKEGVTTLDFQIRSHDQNSSNIQRTISTIHRYFELITLVILFLSGIGIFYLFRTLVFSKVKEIAVLESLGMKKWQSVVIMILQLLWLGISSIAFSTILFYLIKPLLPGVFGNILPPSFNILSIDIQTSSLLSAIFIAVFGSILFTLPIIIAASQINIITLIRQNLEPSKLLNMTLLSFLPMVLFFYSLTVWIGDSFILGSSFSLMFLGTVVIVFLIGLFFWKFFSLFTKHSSFIISFISRNIYQNRSKSFFYFFAISLSVALVSLTPQLEHSINSEIQSPKDLSIPSLFIFDIKKDHLNSLEETITKYNGAIKNPTPIISSEIKTVNGEVFEQIDGNPDQQDEQRRRNQVNLSYRNYLSESETIDSGRELQHHYTTGQPAEVSIEKRFADRNGLKIGDRILFSLINIPFQFEGVIVNLRKVRWNSFQPNFFIMIQDQVLNQVPQKFVAAVEKINFTDKIELIKEINLRFPNVSVLDVSEIIREVLKIISQFSILLQFMASFCFILGLIILFSIINQEIKTQEKEINLLKTIGGRFSTIYILILGEYTLIGSIAIISGFIPSILLNYLLATYFFEGSFVFSLSILLQIFAIMMPSIVIVNYLGARKVLHSKPIQLLKD